MSDKNALKKFVDLTVNIGKESADIQGAGGNTSIKLGSTMYIKPSGFFACSLDSIEKFSKIEFNEIKNYVKSCNDKSYSILEYSNKLKKAKLQPASTLKPSMETGFHSILGNCVIHTHNVFSNIINCSSLSNELFLDSSALKNLKSQIVFIDYLDPGLPLSIEISKKISKIKNTRTVLFLKNHGIIVSENSPEAAKDLYEDTCLEICKFLNVSKNEYIDFEKHFLENWKTKNHFSFNNFKIDIASLYDYEKILTPDHLIILNAVNLLNNADGRKNVEESSKSYTALRDLCITNAFIHYSLDKLKIKADLLTEFQKKSLLNIPEEKERKKLLLKGNT